MLLSCVTGLRVAFLVPDARCVALGLVFFLRVLCFSSVSTIWPVPNVYMFIDHKRYTLWISVSQTFLLSGPFWLRRITTDPCWRTYRVPEWHVSNINNLYFRTNFRQILIHTCSIPNNTMHDLTLIKIIVAHFVGTGFFLKYIIVWSNEMNISTFKEAPRLFLKKYYSFN